MSALYDESKTRTVIVCHPSKIAEIKEDFKGYVLSCISISDDS
jgi:hypothetical protein